MPAHGYLYRLLLRLGFSEFGAETGEFVLVRPLKILLVVVVTMVVARLGGRALRKTVRTFRAKAPMTTTSVRAEQRAETLGDVLASGFRAVVWTIAVFVLLGEVGIDLAPLLAGAGIAGIAIGFGAQSLVKDVISGLFVLLEDQYGVGDVVTVEGATGTIEDLTLRVTRLRSVDGTVWFVPNGEIRKVGNASMEWSRALIDVLVPYDADLDLVRRVITEESQAFALDPSWSTRVLEPPELWGVQSMEANHLIVRLVVKTGPREQFAVARELRGRITDRLRREGVRGPGATMVVAPAAVPEAAPKVP
ncbi:MAG: moderate conductance mechanosensitive channel [Actinomycetota bacterium]|jgi:small conductance mechanosensitive channel|nr:moderate conductance mechanosensitive channel [Actinomycetota bacterium]